MAITAVAGTGTGLLAVLLRVSSEQLLAQALGQSVRTLTALADGTGVLPLAALDGVGGALAGLAGTVDDRTAGLAGLVLLLLLPVGGPAWAGLLPVGAVLAGARTGSRWARARVGRNVPRRRAADDGPMTLRILVVDDSPDFREVARRMLAAEGWDVVGTARSGAEALAAVAALRPEVALVDVNLGTESGFDVADRITRAGEGTTVVLMSTRSEDELAEGIAGSPVAGFVPKQRLSGDAVRALVPGRDR